MAIKAREAAAAAGQLLQEARDELTATEIVLAKLETEVAELQKMIEECQSGDVSSDDILSADSAVTGTVDMKDLETGGGSDLLAKYTLPIPSWSQPLASTFKAPCSCLTSPKPCFQLNLDAAIG